MRGYGGTQREIARRLGFSARSFRRWARRHQDWVPRGRRARRASPELRQEILDLLAEWGPRTSVQALRLAFPSVTRAELTDLLHRFRRVCRDKKRRRTATLEWLRVGAVWAADFAFPPGEMEGLYPELLSVRDLASGMHLTWRPILNETSENIALMLEGLFAMHGAPLVLKVDNAKAWRGEAVLAVLEKWGVLLLFSPPYTPEYNGSIEAGIGATKARTEEESERHQRPGVWTWEDAEAARCKGNVFGKSPIDPKRSPADVWRHREAIRVEEREALGAMVKRVQQETGGQHGEAGQESSDREAHWRRVMRRALGALGILVLRWRRISTLVPERKGDNIP